MLVFDIPVAMQSVFATANGGYRIGITINLFIKSQQSLRARHIGQGRGALAYNKRDDRLRVPIVAKMCSVLSNVACRPGSIEQDQKRR